MVLKLANKKRKKVIITSTSEVYGKANSVPFREDGDLVMGPTSKGRWSYACSKAIDEFLALAYHKEKRLPVVVVRPVQHRRPRQTGRYGMVIPNFVKQGLLGHPITVFGDGTQTRCFTYVSDVVAQLIALALDERAVGQVFNVGNDREEVTILELARRGQGAHRRQEHDRARALRQGVRGGLRGHAAARARPLEATRAHRLRAEGRPRRDPGAGGPLLHLRRHAPVKPVEYRRMFEAEERQWWYAGQRAVALALFEPWARERRLLLLDAGCGTGFNLVALARFGPTLGIDLSEDAIAFCRERGVRRRARLGAAAAVPRRGLRGRDLVRRDLPRLGRRRPRGGRRDGRVLRPGGALLVRVPALELLRGAPRRRGAHAKALHARRAARARRGLRAARAALDLLQLAAVPAAARPGARSTACSAARGRTWASCRRRSRACSAA
jgi:SAM-dependent methyltransferase